MQKRSSPWKNTLPLFFILIFSASTVMAWDQGDRVLGEWNDGLWYPARITEVSGTKFKVNFDDGDVATLSAAKLRKINWIVGSPVQCNWKNQGKYYPGKISSQKGERVHIKYDDGDQENITISRCRSR